jgi:hypothetical protein
MIFLSGCASLPGPSSRTLPPESNVVLSPVAAPVIGPGDDARVAWKKEEAAREEANARLVKSRKIYRGVRASYATGR